MKSFGNESQFSTAAYSSPMYCMPLQLQPDTHSMTIRKKQANPDQSSLYTVPGLSRDNIIMSEM